MQNYKYKDISSSGTALKQFSKLALSKVKDSRDFIIENLQEFIKEEKMVTIVRQFTNLQDLPITQELFDDYKNVIDQDDDNYKVIDKSKCEEYLIQNIARYFQSDTYRKLLNYFIPPLKEEH